jgi:hypothetical protein
LDLAALKGTADRGSVGAQPSVLRLCGVAVFVDEAAEAVDPFDVLDAAGPGRWSVCR